MNTLQNKAVAVPAQVPGRCLSLSAHFQIPHSLSSSCCTAPTASFIGDTQGLYQAPATQVQHTTCYVSLGDRSGPGKVSLRWPPTPAALASLLAWTRLYVLLYCCSLDFSGVQRGRKNFTSQKGAGFCSQESSSCFKCEHAFKMCFCCPCSLVKSQNAPKKLPRGFAGWIMPTCKFTEAELVRLAGTDAAMYLRVQSFGKYLLLMDLCCKHCKLRLLTQLILQAGSCSSFVLFGAASSSSLYM